MTRAQIKAYALMAVMQSNTIFGANVKFGRVSPYQANGDVAAPPALGLYIFEERGETLDDGSSEPQFRQTLTLVCDGRIEMADQYDLDAALDDAVEQIKTALLGNPGFVAQFEKIGRYEAATRVNDEQSGPRFVGEMRLSLDLQLTDRYPPTFTEDLGAVNLYSDLVNVFDPNGSYTPPFAYPVAPAPRKAGPDGRVEIGAAIALPNS